MIKVQLDFNNLEQSYIIKIGMGCGLQKPEEQKFPSTYQSTIKKLSKFYHQRSGDLYISDQSFGRKIQVRPHRLGIISSVNLKISQLIEPKKEYVIKQDKREKIKDTLSFPYSAIGLIYSKMGSQFYTGTGFLIERRFVLTCAHNCYHKIKGKASQILFYPAVEGHKGQSYKVTKIFYPQEYEKHERDEDDYALLQLEGDIGQMFGFLGLDFKINQKVEQNKTIQICGYPNMKNQSELVFHQYSERGSWSINQSGKIINYYVSTSQGQSGSPILIERKGQYFAIGIHTHGSKAINGGVLLTNDIKNMLNKWVSKKYRMLELQKKNIKEAQLEVLFTQKNYSHLTYLDLRQNNISFLNPLIKNLKNLRELNISINKIKELPQQIGECCLIRYLYGRQNQIEKIPGSIKKITELHTLDLCYNKLTVICEQVGKLSKLQRLDISSNPLESLPSQLINLDINLKLTIDGLPSYPQQIISLLKMMRQIYKFQNIKTS